MHRGCARPSPDTTNTDMVCCVRPGVLLNVLFPDWLQTLLLTILLLFVINKTVRKGINQWHQEQAAFRQNRATEELQVG